MNISIFFFYLNVALTETIRNRVWMQIVPLNLSLRIYNSFGSQIRPKFEPTIKLRLGSFPVKCNVTKFKPTITQTGSPTSAELLPQNPIQSPVIGTFNAPADKSQQGSDVSLKTEEIVMFDWESDQTYY